MEVEIEVIACAECGEPIETRWAVGGGLLPGDYDLVADWIFHRECWDRKVAETEGGTVVPAPYVTDSLLRVCNPSGQ